MKIAAIKILFLILLLMSQNCFASRAIIEKPKPFYLSEEAFFDEDNNKMHFDQFEDETVLIIFWASWCGACANSMKSLDTLAKDFRKLPFKVLAISEDDQGITAIKQFYEQQEIRFLKIYHDYRNSLFREMQISSLPTAFIVGPNGKAFVIIKGEVKWHDTKIRDLILEYIDGNPEIPKNTYKKPGVNITTRL